MQTPTRKKYIIFKHVDAPGQAGGCVLGWVVDFSFEEAFAVAQRRLAGQRFFVDHFGAATPAEALEADQKGELQPRYPETNEPTTKFIVFDSDNNILGWVQVVEWPGNTQTAKEVIEARLGHTYFTMDFYDGAAPIEQVQADDKGELK